MSEIDTSTAAVERLMDGVTPGPWEYDEESGKIFGVASFVYEHADARFIASARQLVPALAAERDALRAENERLRAEAAKLAEALREADVFIKQNMGGLRNTKRDAILTAWEAAQK